MNLGKLILGKIISIVGLVKGAVDAAQDQLKGKSGDEKKAAVIAVADDALSLIELATGKDLLGNAELRAALSGLVDLQKALKRQQALVEALIASAKPAGE